MLDDTLFKYPNSVFDIVPSCILVASIAALVLTSALTITPVPIADVPVTFPDPSKDADVQVTSPVIPMVRPVAKAVAVLAFPVTAPVTSPVKFPTNPPVPVIVPDEVILVAVKSGIFAAIFASVTFKLELD